MTNFCNKYLYPKILSVSIYLFFFFHHLAIPTTGNSPPSFYTPQDNIILDCGSYTSYNYALDKRVWIGDDDTTISLFETQSNKSVVSRALKQPSLGDVPYTTARFSYSKFTYMFPVSAGQKFIRLYFYPSSYDQKFDLSKAFFSVKVGPFTLLNNFSAVLFAEAHKVDTFIKEFCINVDEADPMLNITFTPSLDKIDAFAFINGIEIVSMPTNLYYSANDFEGIKALGQGALIRIENSTALEMMYRINIGGRFINPVGDTGMFRIWDKEDEYLTEPGSSVLPVNDSIVLRYTSKPNYSAPADVYKTARSMGMNKTINENYSLTWSFPVDSVFTYLVRLHFCEFEPIVTELGNRVFEIYIANLTAETQADIIGWTGGLGNGIPIYQDYLVIIGSKEGYKQQNLSIALHPAAEWRTNFSDAILNGVEIFKLSTSNGNLAGPNPDLLLSSPGDAPPSHQLTKHKSNQTKMIAIVGGVVTSFFVLLSICFLIFRRKMRVKDSGSSDATSWWGPFSTSTTKSTKSHGSHLPSELCRHFSLSDIKAATNNFDNIFIIGVGGFGNVYKGHIDGGAIAVAIKRLNPGSQQGAVEFKTEIEMLSQLRHLHLVSLIGYCNDDGEMILVYDYMSHGTVRDHLYNNDNPSLPWCQRLEICIGAAKGLHYLHTGAKHTIIHRDVKTTNILLDEKWVAKVSDFGLSKMGPTNMSNAHVSTVVKGSVGYLDPEYYRRQQLTEKSDVYSFGVVLFEVLCARPPINRMVDRKQVMLAEWARQCSRNGTLDQIIDPFLRGKIAPECLKKFGEVAMSCLHDDGIERPSMSDVVWGLEFALQLQEGAEEQIKLGGAHIEVDVDEETPFKDYTTDDSCDLFSSIGEHVLNSKNTSTMTLSTSDDQSFATKDSDRLMSGAVFSEIRNPEGR